MSPPDSTSGRQSAGMTLTLHLGVLIQPYRTKSRRINALTTGDVAQFLEDKYGVMAAFYRVHEKDVVGAVEKSLGGALESLVMGQVIDPWGSGMQTIQSAFKNFIASQEVERVGIAGVPTQAALRGVNHRLKRPYARSNPRRPSFIDSSLYLTNFRAWMST